MDLQVKKPYKEIQAQQSTAVGDFYDWKAKPRDPGPVQCHWVRILLHGDPPRDRLSPAPLPETSMLRGRSRDPESCMPERPKPEKQAQTSTPVQDFHNWDTHSRKAGQAQQDPSP